MATGVPHLMTLADLSAPQINRVLAHALRLKQLSQPLLLPRSIIQQSRLPRPFQSLSNKTVALLFSKRSTRTRLSAETAAVLLGGRALFLGRDDIQLGVNETLRDSAQVISGMCQGIFARVGDHGELEELARHSQVPVLNALSSLWHPTQILADLLTLHEHAHCFAAIPAPAAKLDRLVVDPLPPLRTLTVAYVGDSTNVLHDMLVTYPRMGHKLRIATPPHAAYQCPAPVWQLVQELGCDKHIWWGNDPRQAVRDADVVVTDTWVSMGQEEEKAQRLKDFQGYQVTEALCQGVASPSWKFMHCLPRKEHEVDDEIFYGPRSFVFPEAQNRKWTIMALFDLLVGRWKI